MKAWLFLLGVGVFCGWFFCFSHDPYLIDQANALQGISLQHWFGTDYLGRDVLARVVFGAVHSFIYAACSLAGVVLFSSILGAVAGYIGGLFDGAITLLADILFSLPTLILTLVFAGLFANSTVTVVIALIISWSGKYIRYIRNLVLNIRKEEFILLAPLRGSFGKDTLWFHLFPNIGLALLSLFFTDIGKIIVSISGFSFLGIGIQPPTPELGTILYDGKAHFFVAPWLFFFPGVALTLVVLATQALGTTISKRWREEET